jgi:peptidoglycan/LPS O-acetylase OafA/YrhL
VSVVIFLVLSGYCLMLPVARSTDGRLAGGFGPYLMRRARRILPPYYVALALTLLLFALFPEMQRRTGAFTDISLPAFDPGAVLSHLLMAHNLSDGWIYKINSPMWSVATEWQIYLFFPLVLLPLWRRFGVWAAVAAAFALGLAPHFLLPPGRNGDWAFPWFLGVFALGMAAAVIGFSPEPRVARWRDRLPWGVLSLLVWVVLGATATQWTKHNAWIADVLISLASACLLMFCSAAAARPGDRRRPAVLRVLESRPALGLGHFSYSLYLAHWPLLSFFYVQLRPVVSDPSAMLLWMLLGAAPLSVAGSYLFYRAFERPLLPTSSPSAGRPPRPRPAETLP